MKVHLGRRYRMSPRMADFNTTKVLSTLVEMDSRWSGSSDTIPFLQLITNPKSFGRDRKLTDVRFQKSGGSKIQPLFRRLKDLGVDSASPLVLEHSQNQAAQRILSNRLSVVWGPPNKSGQRSLPVLILISRYGECILSLPPCYASRKYSTWQILKVEGFTSLRL